MWKAMMMTVLAVFMWMPQANANPNPPCTWDDFYFASEYKDLKKSFDGYYSSQQELRGNYQEIKDNTRVQFSNRFLDRMLKRVVFRLGMHMFALLQRHYPNENLSEYESEWVDLMMTEDPHWDLKAQVFFKKNPQINNLYYDLQAYYLELIEDAELWELCLPD